MLQLSPYLRQMYEMCRMQKHAGNVTNVVLEKIINEARIVFWDGVTSAALLGIFLPNEKRQSLKQHHVCPLQISPSPRV